MEAKIAHPTGDHRLIRLDLNRRTDATVPLAILARSPAVRITLRPEAEQSAANHFKAELEYA